MKRVWVVAQREFLETVKTRTFVVSSVLMPLLIIGFMFGTERITHMYEREAIAPRKIVVVDRSQVLAGDLRAAFAAFNSGNPNRPFELTLEDGPGDSSALQERVARGEIFAYLVVPPELPQGDAPVELGRKDGQLETTERIRALVSQAVTEARFRATGMDRATVQQLQRGITLKVLDAQTGRDTTGDEMARFFTPFAFMFLLFMGILNISQGLLTSLIEEKSNRVIEVLLSAVSPLELMSGKILGMVGVGTLLLVIWGTLGVVGARYNDVAHLVSTERIVYMVLYFIPGFLLISAFLAGVGSACNTLKDAQSMSFPLTLITIVPVMMWWQISQFPHSTLSVVFSLIPPITPFVMIVRLCATPDIPLWQVVLTLGLLWASVAVTVWMAAKIFRVGVLMYGKPPTPAELWHWLRVS